jgi:mono/diheme cytochrome c family protein
MKFLACIGALAIIIVLVGAVYGFGGYYNVSAAKSELDVVGWALGHIRAASVARHSAGIPPVSLEDPGQVRIGAHAFAERGCVNCHGAPGVQWAKFSEGLRPYPPDLKKEIAKELEPREVFWVIKNGIEMTGMPSFGSYVDDSEIWTIVAFVKKLPNVAPEDYKAWSASTPAETLPATAR